MASPITVGPLAGVEVGSVVVTGDGRYHRVTAVGPGIVRFGRGGSSWCGPSGLATCPGCATTVRLATPAEAAAYREREDEKAAGVSLVANLFRGLR
jgi:hypothetical protein